MTAAASETTSDGFSLMGTSNRRTRNLQLRSTPQPIVFIRSPLCLITIHDRRLQRTRRGERAARLSIHAIESPKPVTNNKPAGDVGDGTTGTGGTSRSVGVNDGSGVNVGVSVGVGVTVGVGVSVGVFVGVLVGVFVGVGVGVLVGVLVGVSVGVGVVVGVFVGVGVRVGVLVGVFVGVGVASTTVSLNDPEPSPWFPMELVPCTRAS